MREEDQKTVIRLVTVFLICTAMIIQHHHLNQERQRLALLIAVVEHDHQIHKGLPGPELLDACPLPKLIDPPNVDLSEEKEVFE